MSQEIFAFSYMEVGTWNTIPMRVRFLQMLTRNKLKSRTTKQELGEMATRKKKKDFSIPTWNLHLYMVNRNDREQSIEIVCLAGTLDRQRTLHLFPIYKTAHISGRKLKKIVLLGNSTVNYRHGTSPIWMKLKGKWQPLLATDWSFIPLS